MSASRLSDGALAIKKPPSSCRRRFDKPIATHSSRISVGSIITVARKQGLRTTIGLRPDEAPALEADTYMARARLRNGRGPNPGPWRHGSAGPLRAGPAGALRDLGILLPTAARSLRGPRGPRTTGLAGPRRGLRLGRPVHRPLRGRRGRRRLDGYPASADRGRSHPEVFASARGHGPDARAPGGRRSPPVPRRFLRCGRSDGGPRTPRRSEEALPGGEPDPPPKGSVPLDDPESGGPSLPNPSPLPGIRGAEAGLHVDPGEPPPGSPP